MEDFLDPLLEDQNSDLNSVDNLPLDPRIAELRNISRTERSSTSVSSDGSNETLTEESMSQIFSDLSFDTSDDSINEEIGEKITSYFEISMNDVDTGLNFNIPHVKCLQVRQNRHKKSRDDICRLSNSSENLKFSSIKRVHGDKAEILLHSQFGPRYCGQEYLVFKGEMAFNYRYPLCYPKTEVIETKWCL